MQIKLIYIKEEEDRRTYEIFLEQVLYFLLAVGSYSFDKADSFLVFKEIIELLNSHSFSCGLEIF